MTFPDPGAETTARTAPTPATAPAAIPPPASGAGAAAAQQRHPLVATPAQRRSWFAITAVGLLAGIAQMGLWLLIAPRQQWVQYARDGSALVLPTEDVYRFTSIAIFSMLSIIIGVVLAVAAWQLRTARGTTMLLAGAAGLAAGSALALWLGPVLAGGDYPWELLAEQGRPAVDRLVTFPPTISWITVIISPLSYVLLYTFMATWHSDPELASRDVNGPEANAPAGPDQR
ncbi:DUF2567 domain-containing protein [Nakamurella aerolata]|uniref:DUF2567 domain-containing protein n=1 Tax=Nakamurella aerolata TaxID=1656892 RepID=A0A849A825_9ACTN|nr:DUF2567 domain-containing protein [Nakamurella aerolata]NNG34630.1 DUF2567 domain-containing protein [Nakamurella aerolata]